MATHARVQGRAPIRVLIADDDPRMRHGLTTLVEREAGLLCAGAVSTAREAIDLASRERPDVAIVDVRMPGGGAAAARGIRRVSPGTRMIAHSAHDDRATVVEMLEAGVVGYLVKGESAALIVDSIERAGAGEGRLSAGVTAGVIDELVAQLTQRSRSQQRWRKIRRRICQALEESDRFHMVLQPLYALADGSIMGVERSARRSSRSASSAASRSRP